MLVNSSFDLISGARRSSCLAGCFSFFEFSLFNIFWIFSKSGWFFEKSGKFSISVNSPYYLNKLVYIKVKINRFSYDSVISTLFSNKIRSALCKNWIWWVTKTTILDLRYSLKHLFNINCNFIFELVYKWKKHAHLSKSNLATFASTALSGSSSR